MECFLVRLLVLGLSVLVFQACGDVNDIEEDIVLTGCPGCPTAVWLTEENHGEGWGMSDCFACHPVVRLHVATLNPYMDLEQIREIVDRDGLDSCQTCHGGNGI